MFKNRILDDLEKVVSNLGYESSDIVCSIPKNLSHGDYTSNIALQLAKQKSTNSKQNPIEIAREISKKLKGLDYLEKIEVAGEGFINFYIKPEQLMQNLHQVCDYACFVDPKPKVENEQKQKIFVEYASFNALKPVHIGHLRNITLGESITRLLEANGMQVYRATYTSDIGLPAAKVVWGLLKFKDEYKEAKKKDLRQKAEFLGLIYVKANSAYEQALPSGSEDEPKSKAEIDQINTKIYQRDEKLVPIWQEALNWTFEYFDSIYELVGSRFDKQFLESEAEGSGAQIVRDNIGKVFKQDQGAIIFPGEEFGLHNRVFITSAGNPTYEAKEMALADLEYTAFPFDLAIHIVANDQDGYFKVVFKALDLLNHDLASKERHLSYGYVSLPSGKMSSRKGNVVTLEQLYDLVKKEVGSIVNSPGSLIRSGMTKEEKEEIIKTVSLGAIKFALLKYGSHTDVAFDLEKSVSLIGDSGPYIQYTYARAKSVLRNAQYTYQPAEIKGDLEKEELILLRQVEHFDSIIKEAAINYAPHLVANFLVEFARNFNLFYQKHPIVKHEKSELRLALTCAVAVRIKQGLYLLGIEVPERM